MSKLIPFLFCFVFSLQLNAQEINKLYAGNSADMIVLSYQEGDNYTFLINEYTPYLSLEEKQIRALDSRCDMRLVKKNISDTSTVSLDLFSTNDYPDSTLAFIDCAYYDGFAVYGLVTLINPFTSEYQQFFFKKSDSEQLIVTIESDYDKYSYFTHTISGNLFRIIEGVNNSTGVEILYTIDLTDLTYTIIEIEPYTSRTSNFFVTGEDSLLIKGGSFSQLLIGDSLYPANYVHKDGFLDMKTMQNASFSLNGKHYVSGVFQDTHPDRLSIFEYRADSIFVAAQSVETTLNGYGSIPRNIALNAINESFIFGISYSVHPSLQDQNSVDSSTVLVQKYDDDFNLLWETKLSDGSNLWGHNILATEDGGCIVYFSRIESNTNPDISNPDLYYCKFDENGLPESYFFNEHILSNEEYDVSKSVSLHFLGDGQISFLSSHKLDAIRIFNIQGQLIKTVQANELIHLPKHQVFVYSAHFDGGQAIGGKFSLD